MRDDPSQDRNDDAERGERSRWRRSRDGLLDALGYAGQGCGGMAIAVVVTIGMVVVCVARVVRW